MYKICSILFLLGLLTFSVAPSALAGGVVTDCSSDVDLIIKLEGGGLVTFNCGTAKINLNSTITINDNTSIDGANKITLNGSSGVRLFLVDPNKVLSLQNIVLERGYFNGDGGAIYNQGTLSLSNTTIQNSYAPNGGGAIATTGPVDITNSKFIGNISSVGAAIYGHTNFATITIVGSEFKDNKVSANPPAGAQGGAINLSDGAAATIRQTNLHHNTAFNGGAIAVVGATSALSLQNSQLQSNIASSQGGGIYNEGKNTEITTSTVFSNSAQIGGGLMNRQGTSTVSGSNFLNNKQTIGGYGGAAINNYFAGALLQVNNTTFSGNTAVGGGAGIENSYGAVANVTNSTFSGNSAGNTGGSAGGFHNYRGTATLVNVTFFGNASPSGVGGGIWSGDNADAHINLKNVIVTNSPSGGNCAFITAPDTSVSNLSSDNTCHFGAGRDSRNLLLGPLATNGGPTKTHLPQSGSPAIDSGTDSGAPNKDQRGIDRPQGQFFDVGSVEVECAAPGSPALLKPKNQGKVKKTNPALDWGDARCAASYVVQLKQGSKTGPQILKQKTDLTKMTTPTLIHGETYYWRIVAKNDDGKGKSVWYSFEVR